MNIAAIGALPWKEILLLGPGMVETGRRLYESLKKKNDQVEEDGEASSSNSLSTLSSELKSLQLRFNQNESAQEQLSELIAQMTTQEEALAQGLRVVSTRLSKLLWVSGSALVTASVAVVLVFVLGS